MSQCDLYSKETCRAGETGMTMAKKRPAKEYNASALITKPEESVSLKRTSRLSSKISATGSHEANQENLSSSVSKREKIALLAYAYWEQRDCKNGSAEEDWFRAERKMDLV
jgi:hypothetical protein